MYARLEHLPAEYFFYGISIQALHKRSQCKVKEFKCRKSQATIKKMKWYLTF